MGQVRAHCALDSQGAMHLVRGLPTALGFEEMRTQFGTRLSRFLRGGVVLSALESWTLQSLVSSLPPDLQQIVEAQFQRYVLVQREVDGRALNFYPRRSEMKGGLSAPALQMEGEEAPLVRIKFSGAGHGRSLHAALTAVLGRAFCVSFSNDVRPFSAASGFELENVEQSWRSNFNLTKAQQAVQPDRREDAAPG